MDYKNLAINLCQQLANSFIERNIDVFFGASELDITQKFIEDLLVKPPILQQGEKEINNQNRSNL